MGYSQKMYSSMDASVPCIKLAKGGAVSTAKVSGVKTSNRKFIDKAGNGSDKLEAGPDLKKGGRMHKAIGGPVSGEQALPKGRIMQDKKGGKVHKAMGGPVMDKDEATPKGPVMNKRKGGKVEDERLCYGGKS